MRPVRPELLDELGPASSGGPENPTRAALAFLVAQTAVEEGHEVRLFLAGDGVQLAQPETAEAAHGIGTGSIAEHR